MVIDLIQVDNELRRCDSGESDVTAVMHVEPKIVSRHYNKCQGINKSNLADDKKSSTTIPNGKSMMVMEAKGDKRSTEWRMYLSRFPDFNLILPLMSKEVKQVLKSGQSVIAKRQQLRHVNTEGVNTVREMNEMDIIKEKIASESAKVINKLYFFACEIVLK